MKSKKSEVRTMRKFLKVFRALTQAFTLDGEWLREVKSYSSYSCPITAVCKEVTGAEYMTHEARKAARKMRFPMRLACEVMDAADYAFASRDHIDRKHKVLRRRLLEAKGLL